MKLRITFYSSIDNSNLKSLHQVSQLEANCRRFAVLARASHLPLRISSDGRRLGEGQEGSARSAVRAHEQVLEWLKVHHTQLVKFT